MYGGGAVLGAATTVAGAIVLPNTGSNRTLAIAATLSIIVGVLVLATTAVRFIAKKAYDSKH
jgi:hypothetical protein